MALILTPEAIRAKRIENKDTVIDKVYNGDGRSNLKAQKETGSRPLAVTANGPWVGSEDYARCWNAIEVVRSKMMNATMLPDDITTLTDAIRIDLTRRRMEEPDYTAIVGQEINLPNAGPSVTLDEFLPYGAIFKEIQGNNDAVPLIEHKTGATGTLTFDLFAVGDKTSLKDVLFDGLYSLEKVNAAAARGYAALRNSRNVLGRCVAKTTATSWDATQQVAADATSGASRYELLYNTLVSAMLKLAGLKDPQTGIVIPTSRLMLAIPAGTEMAFDRVLNGVLNAGKVGNYGPLTQIQTVIPYRGDTIYAGKETATYAGVASGKAYLFVPQVGNYTVTKRPLTVATGNGSVLELGQQERAFYFCDSYYDTEFFGDSEGLTAGTGMVVEISLPTL